MTSADQPQAPSSSGDTALFNMLIFWATATLNSAQRVLSETNHSPWPDVDVSVSHTGTRNADAALMVLSMRNLLRSSTFVGHQLELRYGFDYAPILDRFDSELPGVVNARDALEHFDEYATGDGRLQRLEMIPYDFELEMGDAGPVVTIGPIRIDVLQAREACRRLVIGLLAQMDF